MSSNIKIKRSEVSGNPSTLAAGELAYSSLADTGSNGGDRLYIGMGTETAGNAVNHIVIGGKFFTDAITAATNSSTALTLVKRDASGNFSAGNITASFTGNLTGIASSTTKWETARNLSLTGDATATLTAVDGSGNVSAALTLATVNTATGSFGSATQVPILTVNAKGLVTGVTLIDIAQAGAGTANLAITGDTGTDTVSTGIDTLNFLGGTGVTTVVTNNQIAIDIGQDVGTTSNVTFNDVTVNGTFNSDDITANSINVVGNAVIVGNLTVQGTTTTVNSTTLEVADLNVVVGKYATNNAEANGAGLTVNGSNATITYSSTDDRWNLNKNLNVATVYGALSGNATTASAWATARDLSLTGDATASLVSVNGSANVSAAITLATVNSDVGTYGSASTIPSFTVNAKGLVTAVANTAIATATSAVLGLASFASTDFTVTAGAVSIKAVDGGTY